MTASDKAPVGRRVKERFVLLPHWLLRSPAWKTLAPDAKAVLLDIWLRHDGANNGMIGYAIRDAEEIALSKDKAARAIAQLVERGFLRVRGVSNFQLKTKQARTWELTAERCGDTPAAKDFMKWVSGEKSISRSHQCDTRSHQCDRSGPNETKLPVSVAPVRPSPPKSPDSRSHQCDTYNIPYPLACDGVAPGPFETETTPPPPTEVATDPAPDSMESGVVVLFKRDRHQKQEREKNSAQIDLEDFLGCPVPLNPIADIRHRLDCHLDKAPRGEQARIARALGITPSALANFKAGRDSLNPNATRLLRQILGIAS
ncbi:MAG: hypothetical protein WCC64_09905 [Aliidongia sp.]